LPPALVEIKTGTYSENLDKHHAARTVHINFQEHCFKLPFKKCLNQDSLNCGFNKRIFASSDSIEMVGCGRACSTETTCVITSVTSSLKIKQVLQWTKTFSSRTTATLNNT